MRSLEKTLYFLIVVLLLSACNNSDKQRVHNINAFAHTYGLIRWFHPSDEAAEIDWNTFALYGVKEVADCRSKKELRQKLEELFLPIAPTISFSGKYDSLNYDDYISSLPVDKESLLPIFWQHSGVDLGIWSNNYVSKRANRPFITENISKLALYGYFLPDKGHRIRMSAKIKVDPASPDPALHMMLIKPSRNDFPNSGEAYVKLCVLDTSDVLQNNRDWHTYEREITIDNSPGNMYWGLYTEYVGTFLVENIILYDLTTNSIISQFLFGSSKEENTVGEANERVIRENPITFDYKEYDDYLSISSKNLIFEDIPATNSVISRKIGSGLYISFPLVSYGDFVHTYPIGDQHLLERLNREIDEINTEKSKIANIYKEYADIIVTWNVIKYFSPYLNELSLNWDDELVTALRLLKENKSDNYSSTPLELMIAKLEDAHVQVITRPGNSQQFSYSLPFSVKKIGEDIVVEQSINPQIKPGDIVRKINDEDMHKKYTDYEKRVSGSPFHKNNVVSLTLHSKYSNYISIRINIVRNEEEIVVETSTIPAYTMYNELYTRTHKEDNVRQISENITYMNVSALDFDRVAEILEQRNGNQTIIFDIRNGAPNFLLRYIIPLLADESLPDRRDILITPQVIYPNTPIAYDTLSLISPKTPNLKNIFLIDSNSISHLEETIDYIRYAGLGYFIGSNTAGCSGMKNIIPLPSGGEVVFTGAKSLSQMGAEHYYYRIGIKPDYFIEDTIESIGQGKDIVLEKALEIIQNTTN